MFTSACHRSTDPSDQGEPSETTNLPSKQGNPTENRPSKTNGDGPSMEGVAQLRAVTVRQEQGILADEIRLGDQAGNWQTEAFHNAIKQRLKSLAKLIESGKWEQSAEDLFADDFVCSDMRPAEDRLAQVFGDPHFKVLRPTAELTKVSPAVSSRGFADAFRQLVRPIDSSRCEIHFKVFKVALEDGRGSSEMYVDTDGVGSDGGVQQNMVWLCNWELAEQDVWKLSAIRTTHFEEVHYRSPRRTLFSDCTESVLSANDCFKPHLLRGIDHWRLQFEERFGIDSVSLTGLAIGDVNGDGLDDFYFCEVGGLPNRLFVQQLDGTATDISVEAGVDWLDRSHGPCFRTWTTTVIRTCWLQLARLY